MANDALDAGPDGTYPFWPRRPDGTPDPERMPTGTHRQRARGDKRPGRGGAVLVDVTPRRPDGTPIDPPTLPPEEEG